MASETTTPATPEQPKAKLQPVRFLKNYNCYNEGEVASFSEEHAAFLVKRRIAEKVTLPKEEDDDMAKGKDPSQPQNRQTTGTASRPTGNNK